MATTEEWSAREQELLEQGLAESAGICDMREKWRAIAVIVGTRNARACAERYQACRAEARRAAAAEEDDGGEDDEEEAPAAEGAPAAEVQGNRGRVWRSNAGDNWSGWNGSEWWSDKRTSWDSRGKDQWWSASSWAGASGSDAQEAGTWREEEESAPPLDENQRRAEEMRREVEANRERLRQREVQREEEQRRREAKRTAEEEKKREEERQKLAEREREYERAREMELERKRREQEAERRAKAAAEPFNAGFGPARPKSGPAPKHGGWAAKAKAGQKGQFMRQRKQEELERRSAEALAAIAATSTAKASAGSAESDATEEEEELEAPPASAAPPATGPSGRAARAPIGPRCGAARAEEETASAEPAAEVSATSEPAGADADSERRTGKGGRARASIGPRTGKDASTAAAAGASAVPTGDADDPAVSSGPRQAHGKKKQRRWWDRLDGDCPISLAPLCELPAPPFGLEAEGSANKHYFDARFLASFLLSSCDFIDPVNRRPLTRQECSQLDAHLLRHYPLDWGDQSVVDAFTLFERQGSGGEGEDAAMHAVRHEATAVLQHLFRFSSARRTDWRGRAIAHADASLTVVDDDDILTRGPALAPAARRDRAEPTVAPTAPENFPSLDGGSGEGGSSSAGRGTGGSWRGRGSGKGGLPSNEPSSYPALPVSGPRVPAGSAWNKGSNGAEKGGGKGGRSRGRGRR